MASFDGWHAIQIAETQTRSHWNFLVWANRHAAHARPLDAGLVRVQPECHSTWRAVDGNRDPKMGRYLASAYGASGAFGHAPGRWLPRSLRCPLRVCRRRFLHPARATPAGRHQASRPASPRTARTAWLFVLFCRFAASRADNAINATMQDPTCPRRVRPAGRTTAPRACDSAGDGRLCPPRRVDKHFRLWSEKRTGGFGRHGTHLPHRRHGRCVRDGLPTRRRACRIGQPAPLAPRR